LVSLLPLTLDDLFARMPVPAERHSRVKRDAGLVDSSHISDPSPKDRW
jgi:hypothetical protein